MTGRRVGFALRLGVSAATIWLAWRLVGGSAALQGLRAPELEWLVLTALLQIAIFAILALRLGIVMRVLGEPVPDFLWRLRLTWAAFGFSQVALGSVGGDGYRLFQLGRQTRGWRMPATIVLGDRLLGLVGLAIVGFIGLLLMPVGTAPFAKPTAGLLAVGIAIGVGAYHLSSRRAQGRRAQDRQVPRPSFRRVTLALPWRLASSPAGWAALGLAVTGHLLSITMYYTVGRGFGFLPPFPETLVALSGGLFAAILPISLGGWGAREVAVSASFVALGAEFAQSVTVSVLYGLAGVALGLPGMIYAWQDFFAFGKDG